MHDDDKLATADNDIIEEAKKYRKDCLASNTDNIKKGKEDLDFLEGGDKQWDAADAQSRRASGRPLITINKLPTFLNQVVNDNLQNTPAIKVHPVDDGADMETAEIIGGIIRHIEYASNADTCYDSAAKMAASIGFGYFRLITDFCDENSFDQDIKFCRIPNPFSVHFDYASTELDGSDALRVLIETQIDKVQFRREYPKSKAPDHFVDHEWVKDSEVLVGEYYRVEFYSDTLLRLSNGEAGFKSELLELPMGVGVVQERKLQRRKIMLYKLTATEILERVEIMCKWIPVIPVYGNELNNDGRIVRSGIIRDGKDPAKMYNYMWTSALEEIASRSKSPYIMAEGQDEGYEQQWQYANRSTQAVLKYKPTTVSGQLAPAPQRQQMAEFPAGYMGMAMTASDDIKATTGLFDASLGANGTATSGRQEIAQQRQGDLATYHFTDNLQKSIRQAGRCLVSMIPKYIDTPRAVMILGDEGEIKHVQVNQQIQPEQDPKTGKIKTVLNDVTAGKYDITISTGPSYQTQRQESAEAMVAMAGNYPELMAAAGDEVIEAMDWPKADKIAARVKKFISLQMPGLIEKEEGEEPEMPPEMMQAMEQDHQKMQELQQQLAEMSQQLESKQQEQESKERIEAAKNDNNLDVAELKGLIELLKAQVMPPPSLVNEVNEDMTNANTNAV